MATISTHILDTAAGKPAQGISTLLFVQDSQDPVTAGWRQICIYVTNEDGRIPELKQVVLDTGVYRVRYEIKSYFDKMAVTSFYPFIEITFNITSEEHYHVPLLLSPYGYSTYRGS